MAGRRAVVASKRRGQVFTVPPGASIAAGAARDRFGNSNGQAVAVPAGGR
jgi:hypothetical protein